MTTQIINIHNIDATSKKVLYSTKNKKLIMITKLFPYGWYTYFQLIHDGELVDYSEDLLGLINQYNKISP